MTLDDVLQNAEKKLAEISGTPRLDAELLLMHVMDFSRTKLVMHFDKSLTSEQQQHFEQLISRRMHGEPIAYIIGHKAFWDFDLKVTKDTLIPRPETEDLIEWLLQNFDGESKKVADLGVGSGAIAITLAHEKPNWLIHATDINSNTLIVAEENAKNYELKNLKFYQGSWCEALPEKNYDLIISNPPYIKSDDPHLQALRFEPIQALDGGPDGLRDLTLIIEQAKNYLKPGGMLVLEHGYDQRSALIRIMKNFGYTDVEDHEDLAHQPRFISGKI